MNRTTKTIVSIIGALLGFAGIDHGFFEAIQGNTPTPGLLIMAIGEGNPFGFPAGEGAFSIVPNFLVTGILAMLVGATIIVWSVGFVHKKHGATVFLLLFILLLLVGGGIGQIVFFLPAWGIATRIHKPLAWWRRALPEPVRGTLSAIWPVTLAISVVSFLIGLYIAISGQVPGVSTSGPDQVLAVCWAFVFGGGLGGFVLSFISGFASDLRKQAGEKVYGIHANQA
ncbi:MAG TPA: hypothetical protein VMT46_11375 [Anaerolineaceae bacterium]|nr:hypothetical protein [Anaerolineaceae bacterium]